MFQNKAKTVSEYLAGLPPERRELVSAARDLVNRHVPAGYEEQMNWGAINWAIPLSRFPDTYNGQPLTYAALAATKAGASLYLMAVYGNSKLAVEFEAAWKKSGKRLDMGKSCVHFKTLDDLALDAVKFALAAATPDAYIAWYQKARGSAKPATGSKKAGTARKSKSRR